MPNPTIYQITTTNGTVYDIEDRLARAQVGGAIIIRGVTETALTDDATTNPIIINSESYTAGANDAVFYDSKEFVFDGVFWHEFGDMSGLGAMATADTASASYVPAGSVSTPVISLENAGSTTDIVPFGSAGALPELTMTVSNGNLAFSFNRGTLPSAGEIVTVKTGDGTYSSSTPTFTGTAETITVSPDI